MNYRVCFAAYLRRQGKSPATIKKYLQLVLKYISHWQSRRKRASIIKGLQVEHIDYYKQNLLNVLKLRPSTINGRLTAMSAFARFLMVHGRLAFNPLDLVARVRSDGS